MKVAYSNFLLFMLIAFLNFAPSDITSSSTVPSDTVPTRPLSSTPTASVTQTSTHTHEPTGTTLPIQTSTPTLTQTSLPVTSFPTPTSTEVFPPSVVIWTVYLPSVQKLPLPPTPTLASTKTSTPTLIPTSTQTVTLSPTGTHTPTATPLPPTNTPIPAPSATPTAAACAPNYCDTDSCNCSDFNTQASAQALHDLCFVRTGRDIHRLDFDGNGVACENLPRIITIEEVSLKTVVRFLKNGSE